ncbi:MAG TPA: hypothetical protein VMF69_21950 [Gemmataceae bacterium]|nr:hypothetical protein [Gemmataceae bacterium]
MGDDRDEAKRGPEKHRAPSGSPAKRRWQMPRVIVASSLLRAEVRTSPPAADSHSTPFFS